MTWPPRRPVPWVPARLLRLDVRVLTVVLLATATVRSFDYMTGHDADTRGPQPGVPNALVGIEALFPLYVWGLLMLTSITVLAVGMVSKWHAYVWWGHVLLCALYTGLCAGLVYGYLQRDDFDGIRTGAGLALPASLHLLLFLRMGRRPANPWRTVDGRAA